MSLEAKIKALLEGEQSKDADLLSEEELVESVVELDEEGNPIVESKKEEDDDDEDEDKDKDEVNEDDEAAKNAKIKAGLAKKLDANGEIAPATTDEPNNKRNNVDKNMVKEHIDALTSGEDLSEDFKAKAAVIMEAAVNDAVNEELDRLEEENAQKLDEAVNAVREQLVEDIDGFLNAIVENWMEENELALERGIKVDILENFIDGMRNLFKEHYIEVPEEKMDILDEQAEQIEILSEKNTELMEENQKLSEEVNASKKVLVIESVGSELTDTDFEKFVGLMENVEYSDDFETKAKTMLESYFPKAKKAEVTENLEPTTTVEVAGNMSKYVEALAGQLKFN